MYKWVRTISVPTMNAGQEDGFVRTARIPYKVLYALLFTLVILIIVLLLPSNIRSSDPKFGQTRDVFIIRDNYAIYTYNSTYPLTDPVYIGKSKHFRIAVIADQDTNSKVSDGTWTSKLKTGSLILHEDRTMSVKWDKDSITVATHMAEKRRGAELSDLCVFNGRLYTVCDRTGIVFEVTNGLLVPWVILEDGNGAVDKGFKGEWMTVKDRHLYIGSIGKVWTSTAGQYLNDNPQFVKVISPLGHLEHKPWANMYNIMKSHAGIKEPGYVIHESSVWSQVHKKWFFLPRRASTQSYDDTEDEHRATNLLITADETFSDVQVTTIGVLNSYRGFSSFKFLPGSSDSVIVAIKSEEIQGKIASYILAFDLQGLTLLKEEKIDDGLKFEGIEFI